MFSHRPSLRTAMGCVRRSCGPAQHKNHLPARIAFLKTRLPCSRLFSAPGASQSEFQRPARAERAAHPGGQLGALAELQLVVGPGPVPGERGVPVHPSPATHAISRVLKAGETADLRYRVRKTLFETGVETGTARGAPVCIPVLGE